MSTPHGGLKLEAAAATSIGLVRVTNEDRYLTDENRALFAVADGIGGLPYGERASEEAVRCLSSTAQEASSRFVALDELVLRAHTSVRELGAMLSPSTGIGTTLTAARISDLSCEIAHVGDSRAYLFSAASGRLCMLTTDHTIPLPPIRVGAEGEQVFQPPPRLDRYLGRPATPVCDCMLLTLCEGDRLILCTDGVTRSMEDWELAAISQVHLSPAGLARALIGIADSRGGLDNATVVVIDVPRRQHTSNVQEES